VASIPRPPWRESCYPGRASFRSPCSFSPPPALPVTPPSLGTKHRIHDCVRLCTCVGVAGAASPSRRVADAAVTRGLVMVAVSPPSVQRTRRRHRRRRRAIATPSNSAGDHDGACGAGGPVHRDGWRNVDVERRLGEQRRRQRSVRAAVEGRHVQRQRCSDVRTFAAGGDSVVVSLFGAVRRLCPVGGYRDDRCRRCSTHCLLRACCCSDIALVNNNLVGTIPASISALTGLTYVRRCVPASLPSPPRSGPCVVFTLSSQQLRAQQQQAEQLHPGDCRQHDGAAVGGVV
jgi:hypothetical protein